MCWDFPSGSVIKTLPANAGDVFDPWRWRGRSLGEENGNPLQYSCMGNPMDREPGGLQSIGLQKSWTQLSN